VSLRRSLKTLSLGAFRGLDRAGVHVLPKHYYTPVADRAWLRSHPSKWRRALSLEWDYDAQLAWLRDVCRKHYGEVAGFRAYRELVAQGFGPGYGLVESQVLHCLVRSQAPARIVEIGGGVTSAIMARAARMNAEEGRPGSRITTVEPSPWLPLLAVEGIELLRITGQDAPRELFDELGNGDVLFIDSSHAVKTGSEVQRLYLEIVPGLAEGVTIHVHDIYLPYAYSPWVLHDYFDPQETALVAALLQGNDRLEVLCCESALHHKRPAQLAEILGDYHPQPMRDGLSEPDAGGHFPSSLWLRTVRTRQGRS
jgi:hypothetical protein